MSGSVSPRRPLASATPLPTPDRVRINWLGWLWSMAILAVSVSPSTVKAHLRPTGVLHQSSHLAVFLLGALLVCYPAQRTRTWSVFTPWLIAVACSSELLEVLVYRISFEWYDLAADFIGILLGL